MKTRKIFTLAVGIACMASVITGCTVVRVDVPTLPNDTPVSPQISGGVIQSSNDNSSEKSEQPDIPIGIKEDSIDSILHKNATDLVMRCNKDVNSYRIDIVNRSSVEDEAYNEISKTTFKVDKTNNQCYMETETNNGEKSYIYMQIKDEVAECYCSNNGENWVKSSIKAEDMKYINDIPFALKESGFVLGNFEVTEDEIKITGYTKLISHTDTGEVEICNDVSVAIGIKLNKEDNTVKSMVQSYKKDGTNYKTEVNYTDYDNTVVEIPEKLGYFEIE